MRFTLTYSGPLPPKKSRGVSPVKAQLRAVFHEQLKPQVEPVIREPHWPHASTLVDGHRFVSPVHRALRTAVELDILLLTPSRARAAGDTDNRLKTLIDGLTRPSNSQQMSGFAPAPGHGPTYCLLDDDALVQSIRLDSRQWHEPKASRNEAFVVVTAKPVLSEDFDLSGPVTPTLVLVM